MLFKLLLAHYILIKQVLEKLIKNIIFEKKKTFLSEDELILKYCNLCSK